MREYFSAEYTLLWALVLAVALFFPVRRLIWMLAVNRAARKTGQEIDESERGKLRRKASITAALLCYIFSYLYTYTLLHD